MVSSCFRVLGLATALGATLGVGFYGRHAHADSAPVIAIPGHLGVPVIINGIDATGAEVFGDWGLSRPGQGSLIIEGGTPMPLQRPPLRYFPTSSSVSDPDARQPKATPSPSRAPPPPAPGHQRTFISPGRLVPRPWATGRPRRSSCRQRSSCPLAPPILTGSRRGQRDPRACSWIRSTTASTSAMPISLPHANRNGPRRERCLRRGH